MSDYSYFCSTSLGLYRCADWHYDNSTPTWEHTAQSLAINEFALDLNDPDEFQACRSGNTIYARRPTHYEDDDWHEVFSVTAANAQFDLPDFVGLGWIEINSAPGKEGHMYAQGHTGLNSGGKHIYLLKSIDYGGTWSRYFIIGGTIRATGGVWASRTTGDVLYASYNGHGLISTCKTRYSTDEGHTWAEKHVMAGSLWVTRVMIDPTDEAISYAGRGINGPEISKAYSISGSYGSPYPHGGLCIFYGYGGGWISANDGDYIRTIRDSVLYYSDVGGDGYYDWSANSVSDIGHGASFERAMWGHDSKPHWVGVASRTSVSSPFNNYHLLKSTQDNGGTWYDKAGAHASTADTGGGDSIPYNCGGVAENGVYLVIPGRVFTSVVAMQALPTAGTVYADGVQMGTIATGSTVYAHGVEQESPRQT